MTWSETKSTPQLPVDPNILDATGEEIKHFVQGSNREVFLRDSNNKHCIRLNASGVYRID